jgi:AcrR family transcriptional regulator
MNDDLDGRSRPLRADAARNRVRILDTARQTFAERGLDAPLEQIARDAGVAIGTLYRHFPRRDDLVGAALEAELKEYEHLAQQAHAADDPWVGFCTFLQQICGRLANDAGMCDMLTTARETDRISAMLQRADEVVADLIDHARRAGVLRPDFTVDDYRQILMATAGIIEATRQTNPQAWRRHLSLVLDATRTNRPGVPDDRSGQPAPPIGGV